MMEQLALLPPDPPLPTPTLRDLVRDLDADPRHLPLWAEMAGEAWFAAAWRQRAFVEDMSDLAGVVFGRDEMVPLALEEHFCDDCPREAVAAMLHREDVARARFGTMTLAVLREALARRR